MQKAHECPLLSIFLWFSTIFVTPTKRSDRQIRVICTIKYNCSLYRIIIPWIPEAEPLLVPNSRLYPGVALAIGFFLDILLVRGTPSIAGIYTFFYNNHHSSSAGYALVHRSSLPYFPTSFLADQCRPISDQMQTNCRPMQTDQFHQCQR